MSSSAKSDLLIAKLSLKADVIVLVGITWATVAMVYFLLYSTNPPDWYSPVTYIFECSAYLGASLLCLRNWQSPQIVSGRNVWLLIGLGMLSYFIGDVLFGLWELVWQQDPAVSPGDMLYLVTYICLSWSMIQAVTSRRLNLEMTQWLIIGGLGVVAIAIAVWLSLSVPATVEVASTIAPTATAPDWVLKLEEILAPIEAPVTLLYTVLDVALLIAAATLLLAFWGGRFSQSWQMIAAAAFSLYIADMGFKYALDKVANYESGGLIEVFWIFSPVLFGIGAALEYDLSTRTTRRSRRRS